MSDSPDVSLLFNDVRKMNSSQISKLTKHQLTIALKNAISSTDLANDDRVTASTLKPMIADAVFQLRQELLSEQQRLLSTFQQKPTSFKLGMYDTSYDGTKVQFYCLVFIG